MASCERNVHEEWLIELRDFAKNSE
jgi:hypothetical protein